MNANSSSLVFSADKMLYADLSCLNIAALLLSAVRMSIWARPQLHVSFCMHMAQCQL